MRLRAWGVGVGAALLLTLNTLWWSTWLFCLAVFKLALRAPRWRRHLDAALNRVAACWVRGNGLWMRWTQRTAWDVEGVAGLRRDAWYLVGCNHQSWVDILVMQRVLNGRVPLLKFFLKRELIYVPVMGLAWWALDFPFMRRQTKTQRRRRPAQRLHDQAAARRACERFARVPTTVVNFMEGTRFTPAKHRRQASPYRHLLVPRAGALASTLLTLGPRCTALLDMTIVYPDGVPSFWQFLCGDLRSVVVRCRELPLPAPPGAGEASGDVAFRAALARWLAALWEEKDRLIEELRESRDPQVLQPR